VSTGNARSDGGGSGIARTARRATGVLAAVALLLTVAAPAWAGTSATATLAPIGTGSYLLTVTNTGSEAFGGFVVGAGEEPVPTNIVPSPACKFGNTPVAASINCTITVAPGTSTQMCYTGHALGELLPGSSVLLLGGAGGFTSASPAPAVASCPLAGFKAGSGSTGGVTKCVVPNLKGKKLVAAEKAIVQAHCAVGKVKKAKSSHVKKGSVVSQSPSAGKSLPNGTKVGLVVSKGK
jgi:hypothetical protein